MVEADLVILETPRYIIKLCTATIAKNPLKNPLKPFLLLVLVKLLLRIVVNKEIVILELLIYETKKIKFYVF